MHGAFHDTMRSMRCPVDVAASARRGPTGVTPPRRVPGVAPRRRPAREHASSRSFVTTVRAGKDDVLGDLVRSLFESGRAKVTKDFEELVVEPFSDPDPKPLTGLVPPKSLADVDSKFVTIEMDGESIVVHYKESLPTTTRENKTPNTDALVCMHGANGSTYSFRYLLPRVASAAGLRAIAIDRPPYGLTSRPPAPRYENKSENGNGNENEPKPNYHRVYTPEGQVEFTLKVMDALGIERAALLGHSAGAPVALDVALSEPTRCSALLAVAPAVFVGEKVSSEDDDKQESSSTKSSSGFKLPLDRAIRFAWFRFLIAQDGPGLNVVRGSVRRQTAAVEAGVTYADLDPETRAQYVKPTKTEGWDVGLLQLFRAGLGRFGSGGDRLRTELPKLADNKIKVLVLVGVLDETTPPALAEGFVEAMKQAGMLESDLQYVLLPDANHLPMEQTTFGVRESFEKIVVNKVLELV